MVLQILKSLVLLCSVSGIVAYLAVGYTTKSFIEIFLFATIVQFVFFYFYNSIISYVTRLRLEKENLETIKLINTNNILVECSSCKKTNNVRVNLSANNDFTCTHCGTDNILDFEFKTITKTNIL